MTQTPASGPFALVTTPPMSSASMATAAPGWAATRAHDIDMASSSAIAEAVATLESLCSFMISSR